jgi:hypothetical protein
MLNGWNSLVVGNASVDFFGGFPTTLLEAMPYCIRINRY